MEIDDLRILVTDCIKEEKCPYDLDIINDAWSSASIANPSSLISGDESSN